LKSCVASDLVLFRTSTLLVHLLTGGGLAKLFFGIDSSVDPKLAQSTGAFFYALLAGVMTQWLIDPDHAPSASDLTQALLAVAAGGEPIGAKRR
jgi:hypothetical protein